MCCVLDMRSGVFLSLAIGMEHPVPYVSVVIPPLSDRVIRDRVDVHRDRVDVHRHMRITYVRVSL